MGFFNLAAELAKSAFTKSYDFYNNKRMGLHNDFSPEEEKKFLVMFFHSMNFNLSYKDKDDKQSKIALRTDLFTAINDINSKRITGLEDFDEIKINNKTIYQLLDKGTNKLEEVKSILSNSLKLTEKTQKVLEDYEDQAAVINQMIETPEFNSHLLDKKLQKLSQGIENAFNAQKTHEIEELHKQKDTLSNHFGLSANETKNVINKMEDQISKSYEKNIKNFMQPLQDSHSILHNKMQQERDRIFLFAKWYYSNPVMKKQFDKLREDLENIGDNNDYDKTIIESATAEAEVDFNNQSILFKGIELSDLEILQTITGTPIEKEGDKKYSIKLPTIFGNILLDWNKNINCKKDIDTLVRLLRADGIKKITLSVTNKNSERADELGRILYESAIKAGYDPKDVTIKVNGKVRPTLSSGEDKDDKKSTEKGLYDGHEDRLDRITQQGKERKESGESISKPETDKFDKKFKDEYNILKEKKKVAHKVIVENPPRPSH